MSNEDLSEPPTGRATAPWDDLAPGEWTYTIWRRSAPAPATWLDVRARAADGQSLGRAYSWSPHPDDDYAREMAELTARRAGFAGPAKSRTEHRIG